MKRTISKILAIALVLALAMSVAAFSAFADEYTAVTGGKTSFEKKFVVPATANVPDVDFEFKIDAGTPVALSDTNEIEIFAGPVVTQEVTDETTNETTTVITAPTVENASFDGTSGFDSTNTDETVRIAVDNVEIDLTGITFTQPGVYRYVITEKPNNYNGITNDENAVRYLDVFVFPTEADPSVLEITTYSMRTVDQNSNFTKEFNETTQEWEYKYSEDPGDKSDGYRNELETVDLEFTKKIEGNQADMNKKFKYTLVLEDVNPGTYKVEVTGTDVVVTDETSEDYSNVQVDAETGTYTITINETTVDAEGKYTCYFYLTNGETVTVKDLNKGYKYTLTEDEEDYAKTEGVDNEGDDNDFLGLTADSNVQADVKTGFTNKRTGIIPTGVIITVAPFAIGILVFGAIILYVINKRRRAVY